MAVESTHEDEERLVISYQENTCLYATSDKEYSNRLLRRKVIEEIATALGKSAADVTLRIKNLRTQFGRLVKPPPSGSGRRTRTARQEWILTQLDFLKPHLKARETTSLFPIDLEQPHDEGDDDVENTPDKDEDKQDGTSVEGPSKVTPEAVSQSKSTAPGPNERKLAKKRKSESEYLEAIANSLAKPIEFPDIAPEDEFDIYGKLVAAKLRKITDPRIRNLVTAKINQALSVGEIAAIDVSQAQGTNTGPTVQE